MISISEKVEALLPEYLDGFGDTTSSRLACRIHDAKKTGLKFTQIQGALWTLSKNGHPRSILRTDLKGAHNSYNWLDLSQKSTAEKPTWNLHELPRKNAIRCAPYSLRGITKEEAISFHVLASYLIAAHSLSRDQMTCGRIVSALTALPDKMPPWAFQKPDDTLRSRWFAYDPSTDTDDSRTATALAELGHTCPVKPLSVIEAAPEQPRWTRTGPETPDFSTSGPMKDRIEDTTLMSYKDFSDGVAQLSNLMHDHVEHMVDQLRKKAFGNPQNDLFFAKAKIKELEEKLNRIEGVFKA